MTQVVPAARDEYEAALALLFRRLPADEQRASIADVLKALGRGRIATHALLIARVGGVMTGSILYMLQADRTAFVWPPGTSRDEALPGTEDLLLGEVIRRVEAADAWIGQCLLELDRREDRKTLERNGFKHLTDLRFLIRRLDDLSALPADPSNDGSQTIEAIPYQPGVNDARFARVIEQTYRETRDCPELEGTRTGEQALVSHQMSGDFDPARWKLFRWHGRDAGVLLLNDHPEQAACEVVYLGVAHDCRGNGLGRRMLVHGLTAARAARRTAVMLAVDCRNEYAQNLYDEMGFEETDRRAVHLYLPRRRPPAGVQR